MVFWGWEIIGRVLLGLISAVLLLSINSFISAISEIYSRSRYANRLNIKSYLQIAKLIANIFGIIIIIAGRHWFG